MRRFGIITIALLAILLLTADVQVNAQQAQPATPPKDPESVYRAAYDAQNAGDVDAFVALFAEGAVSLALPPPPGTDGVLVGTEAIRNVTEELVARNIHTDFTDLHVHGDSVTFTALVVEDVFRDIGVFPVEFSGTAVVQDGLIQSEAWHIGKESLARLEAAIALQTNKELLRRAYKEVFNGKNLALLDEAIASNANDHSFPDLSGVEAFKTPIAGLLAAFPDLQVTSDFMVAEGDMVMALATFTGTHQAELFGVAPTGKQITWSQVDINRIQDGKVVEAWHIGSPEAILQALGYQLVPPTE
jgi:predicted ester cyclase